MIIPVSKFDVPYYKNDEIHFRKLKEYYLMKGYNERGLSIKEMCQDQITSMVDTLAYSEMERRKKNQNSWSLE